MHQECFQTRHSNHTPAATYICSCAGWRARKQSTISFDRFPFSCSLPSQTWNVSTTPQTFDRPCHKFFLEFGRCFASSSSSEQEELFNSFNICTVYVAHKLLLLGLKAFCRELFFLQCSSPLHFLLAPGLKSETQMKD